MNSLENRESHSARNGRGLWQETLALAAVLVGVLAGTAHGTWHWMVLGVAFVSAAVAIGLVVDKRRGHH